MGEIICNLSQTIDVNNFKQQCEARHLKPSQVIFLFPGNPSHHKKNVSLYSIKSGGGLARAARDIGKQGYGVLSLPTTGVEKYSEISKKAEKHREIVEKAIEDLYRTIGMGDKLGIDFHFMLPTREQSEKVHPGGFERYFDNSLNYTENESDENIDSRTLVQKEGNNVTTKYEPRFWGGNESKANSSLGNYYITALKKLNTFMKLKTVEAKEDYMAREGHSRFHDAYRTGLNGKLSKTKWLESIKPRDRQIVRQPYQSPEDFRINESLTEFKTQFEEILNPLNAKFDELFKKGYTNSNYVLLGDIVDRAYIQLRSAADTFFSTPPTAETFEIFKQSCERPISLIAQASAKHRGAWDTLYPWFKKLLGCLASLSLIPAIATACTKRGYVGTFFKLPETDTSTKVSTFKGNLENLQNRIEANIPSAQQDDTEADNDSSSTSLNSDSNATKPK